MIFGADANSDSREMENSDIDILANILYTEYRIYINKKQKINIAMYIKHELRKMIKYTQITDDKARKNFHIGKYWTT